MLSTATALWCSGRRTVLASQPRTITLSRPRRCRRWIGPSVDGDDAVTLLIGEIGCSLSFLFGAGVVQGDSRRARKLRRLVQRSLHVLALSQVAMEGQRRHASSSIMTAVPSGLVGHVSFGALCARRSFWANLAKGGIYVVFAPPSRAPIRR